LTGISSASGDDARDAVSRRFRPGRTRGGPSSPGSRISLLRRLDRNRFQRSTCRLTKMLNCRYPVGGRAGRPGQCLSRLSRVAPWISRGSHAMDRHVARARARGSLRVAGFVARGELGSGRQRCVCALPTGPLGRGNRLPLLKPCAERVFGLGGRTAKPVLQTGALLGNESTSRLRVRTAWVWR
jgi:hypothetical protein